MDLFEQLRREHEFGIGTIAGVAAKFGVHRRLVRRARTGALPPKHHYPERSKPKLGRVAAFNAMTIWQLAMHPRNSGSWSISTERCVPARCRSSLSSPVCRCAAGLR